MARSDDLLEVHRTSDGHVEEYAMPMSNAYWYPVFVTDTIDRFANGFPPLASLDDLAAAMAVVDAAYASSCAGGNPEATKSI